MIPPAALADDWLFWDPHAIETYPHSIDAAGEGAHEDAEQLELFEPAMPTGRDTGAGGRNEAAGAPCGCSRTHGT